jgi:hypothetical protein
MSASTVPASAARPAAQPLLDGKRPRAQSLVVHIFVILPILALVAAVPLAWGWGQSWLDVGLAVGFYFLSGFGVTATGQPLPDRARAYAESASITLNTSSRERSSARR